MAGHDDTRAATRALGGLALLAALLLGAPGARAAGAQAPAAPTTPVALADVELVNQEGVAVRFARDVVADQVVVMNFVYTTCTTICPVQSGIFARLQTTLGERLGKDVRLVSISLDPTRDTPERLKATAARYRSQPGWVWLTGPRDNVEAALKGVGAWSADYTRHAPMTLVGDPRTGKWTRLNGFVSQEEILSTVNALLAARGLGAISTAH